MGHGESPFYIILPVRAGWPERIRAVWMPCIVKGVAPPGLARGRDGSRMRETATGYLIACGLIGEPVPPVMISGGPQKKNS